MIIKAKFTFFQMQQKGMLGHTDKLMQATFGEDSERLDAVDVSRALHKFVVAMVDAVVAVKAHIYQPIVAASAIGIDHRGGGNIAPNDTLQSLFRAIRYNFGIYLAPAFEQVEDDSFAARPIAPFVPYSERAEIGLVEFERTAYSMGTGQS